MDPNLKEKNRLVTAFVTNKGSSIYQIKLEAFPGFWVYAYLVFVEDEKFGPLQVLIDAGSGFGDCNDQLESGLETVRIQSGQSVDLASLTHIFITHGHIDHFGGLNYIRNRTKAQVGIHELDRRVLTNYEERLTLVIRRLDEFLIEAGVSEERRKSLMDLYTISKALFNAMPVDFTYEAIGMQLGPFQFLHVPGHCAGHVAIRLHDILFSGDHVLEGISPHQAPERLTLSTGLEHYLNSLEALRGWADGIRLTLGGHHEPITDLHARLDEIRQVHEHRLAQVLELLEEPSTVADISKKLFGSVQGYNVLLALEEAGAHVEYLYQRGLLKIDNLSQMENGKEPIPVLYRLV